MGVRNEEEWQSCWAVAQAEKDRELEVDVIKLPPVKPYRLALKLDTDKKGKVEKKKIYYPNVYDEDVVFKIMVQGDAMAIKESTLAGQERTKVPSCCASLPRRRPKRKPF